MFRKTMWPLVNIADPKGSHVVLLKTSFLLWQNTVRISFWENNKNVQTVCPNHILQRKQFREIKAKQQVSDAK